MNPSALNYTSRIYSFEFDFRPRVTEGLPIILGFRTLQLHERFELFQPATLSDSVALNSHTNNFLYGFQVGAEPYLWGANTALQLDGLLKAGAYGTHSSQGTCDPQLSTVVDAQRGRMSFVGELGLTVVYRFNNVLTARGGTNYFGLMALHSPQTKAGARTFLCPPLS